MKKSLTAVSVIGLVLQANDSLAGELDGKDRDGAAVTGTADELFSPPIAAAGVPAGMAPYDQYIFTTSSSGVGAIGQWAAASGSGLFGTEAADFICQMAASGAGLPNPAAYVAWMSDDQDDAYCRAHGLTGKVASDCGASGGLPDSAGPWLRTDGLLFGGTLAEIVNSGEIYHPVALGASGGMVSPPTSVWTGTRADGTASTQNCFNWSAGASGLGTVGDSNAATDFWTDLGTSACASPARLNCLAAGSSGMGMPPPSPFTANERRAFVTSISGPGDLSSWTLPDGGTPEDSGFFGVEAGDAICRSLADDAGLKNPRGFKALLLNENSSFEQRFEFRKDWYRIDHVKIVDSLGQLFSPDAAILTPPVLDEFGRQVDPFPFVWTGLSSRGAPFATCGDWSSSSLSLSGVYGLAPFADQRMIISGFQPCIAAGRLYCFSDSDQVSTDRFYREDFYD